MHQPRTRRIVGLLIASVSLVVASTATAQPYESWSEWYAATGGAGAPGGGVSGGLSTTDAAVIGAVTTYTNAATFDAAFPGLPTEDFEESTVAPGAVLVCADPIDSSANPPCFAAGDILPGLSVGSVAGLGGATVVLGPGFGGLGNPSRLVGPNSFADTLRVTLPGDTCAVGVSLHIGFIPAETLDITVTTLMGGPVAFTAAATSVGSFLGVSTAGDPIVRIDVSSPSGQGELVDNIRLGATCATPPTFTKSFLPDTITVGGTSTLTFTVDNTAEATAASGLAFADTFPTSVTVADPQNLFSDCTGGAMVGAVGAAAVSFSGGTVAGLGTCTVSVDVTSDTVGTHVNTSDVLVSSNGNGPSATASLFVNPPDPPTFTKLFDPPAIQAGGTSMLILTIDNSAAPAAATALDVSETLPTGVTLATPANPQTTCTGGTTSAPNGGTVFGYTGGSVAAMTVCTVSVDVTSALENAYLSTTGDLTSSSGNSGTASETLTVATGVPTLPQWALVFLVVSLIGLGLSMRRRRAV